MCQGEDPSSTHMGCTDSCSTGGVGISINRGSHQKRSKELVLRFCRLMLFPLPLLFVRHHQLWRSGSKAEANADRQCRWQLPEIFQSWSCKNRVCCTEFVVSIWRGQGTPDKAPLASFWGVGKQTSQEN